MNRRALAALLTSLLAFTGSAATTTARADVLAPSPAQVRINGQLIKTSSERGEPEHAAVRTGNVLIPVETKGVERAASGDRVTIDVAVPATVRKAASSATPLRIKNGRGKTDTIALDAKDLSNASDSTPATPSSDIGEATVKTAVSPAGKPLEVGEVRSTDAAPASYVPAQRKILAVSVVPAGLSWNQPSSSEILNAGSGSNSFWQANSRDELGVSVTQITSGVTSPYGCSNPFGLWNDVADEVGYTWSPDTSLVLFLPKGADDQGCSYGLGTIGSSPNSPGYVYVSDANSDVVAHELGHNMSLMHANSLVCSSGHDASVVEGVWSSGCNRRDYGDGQDVMGVDNTGTPAGMLSSPQALRTGMLEPSATVPVSQGTDSVTLKPLAGGTGTRAATVTNSATGVTYYVEYRTKAGRDTYNAWGQSTGVRVLRVDESDDSSVLLDPSPTGSSYDLDPVLHEGSTFKSYDGAVRITTVSQSSSEAIIKVVNGGGLDQLTQLSAPTISGTPKVGNPLTASPGTWSPTPSSYSYQWQRDGNPIQGATTATYTPTAADAGTTLTVEVTAHLAGHADGFAQSAGMAIPQPAIANEVTPKITGTLGVWQDLAVDLGRWTPSPTSYSYEWRVNGATNVFGDEATYTVWPDDAGATITVRVTAHRDGYQDKTVETAPVTVPLQSFTVFRQPRISGDPGMGNVLTTDSGTWSPSPSAMSYQWRRDGVSIPGATASAYTQSAPDRGSRLTVTVTATRDGYADASSTSSNTVLVPLSTFTSTAVPTISGDPEVGSELTATAGTWNPTPNTTTFQWKRNGVAISGATNSTYTPTTNDAGKNVTVTATATREGYTDASQTSSPVTIPLSVFTSTTAPTISGTPKIGSKLTATAGAWNPAPSTTTFQWKRNGVAISGATNSTYTPTTSDAGKNVTVTATATRDGYADAAKTSSTVSIPLGVFTSATPKVTGTKAVGKTLSVSIGTWSPAPTSYSYRWKRNGVNISGAVGRTYMPTKADAGRYLTITVTGKRSGYATKSVTSAEAGVPIYNVTRPSITGTAKAGRTLTVSKGSWTPLPSSYSYQWYRNGVKITGATARTYSVRSTDRGKKLSTKVTVRRSGYVSSSATTSTKTVAR